MSDRLTRRPRGPARHERPTVDAAALDAARAADRLLAAARATGADRWVTFLEPLPDRLRDEELGDLRRTALRARAAVGPNDSIREVLDEELVEPYVDAVDRLLRELARRAAEGG